MRASSGGGAGRAGPAGGGAGGGGLRGQSGGAGERAGGGGDRATDRRVPGPSGTRPRHHRGDPGVCRAAGRATGGRGPGLSGGPARLSRPVPGGRAGAPSRPEATGGYAPAPAAAGPAPLASGESPGFTPPPCPQWTSRWSTRRATGAPSASRKCKSSSTSPLLETSQPPVLASFSFLSPSDPGPVPDSSAVSDPVHIPDS